ncbi:MAG TPA: hypothetical protein VKD72_31710, partial [Gemmataceae bacterium]|nr:hypothetical protein [Gemmataceae bacterium]
MTMRTILTLLVSAMVVMEAGHASAQVGGRTGTPRASSSAGASSSGVNTNTLSTGNNTNTNSNTNSQFYSGGNAGVNNGSLEVYSGADPYQGIVIEGSPSLPQLPGFVPPLSNFSQPYKPDTFVNGPVFLPKEMTLAEAKACRDSSVRWYGASHPESVSIKLFYASQKESPGVPLTMANYVGTAIATSSDRPFITALCEAAYKAMNNGASVAVVDFIIRPKNTMLGIGFGTSGGATGLPAAGTHPYAIAGALGFGTGWSNQKVEGEVMLQLTGLRGDTRAASASARTQPTPQVQRVATSAASPSAIPASSAEMTIALHPPESLARLKRGDPKSQVVDMFPTSYTTRKGQVVKVEGIRLRLPQRSPRGTLIEIGEVAVGRQTGPGVRYWLLFENGKLLAWGQPHEWEAAAKRYQVNVEMFD